MKKKFEMAFSGITDTKICKFSGMFVNKNNELGSGKGELVLLRDTLDSVLIFSLGSCSLLLTSTILNHELP